MSSRINIPELPIFQIGSLASRWLVNWIDSRREDHRRGWALVVPDSIDPIFMVMLRSLMEHRQRTLCRRGGKLEVFRFRKNGSVSSFMRYHGLNDEKNKQRPYYLLMIGGENCLPMELEQALTEGHAVGRLELPIPEAYYHYVSNLISVETRAVQLNRGVTFLNHTDEGVQVAERFMRERSPSKWRVCEMSSHPHGNGTRVLSLHVARDNDQSMPWSNGKPVLREAPLDPSGQVIVRVEDHTAAQSQPHPYHHQSSLKMLSHPIGSALAMVHLHPSHATQGMHAALTGLLAGLPVGASLHGGGPTVAGPSARSRGYRIAGDPATGLG